MPEDFSPQEQAVASSIVEDLTHDRIEHGAKRLSGLIDEVYAGIPDKQRQSRGITWAMQRVSHLLAAACDDQDQMLAAIQNLRAHIPEHDRMLGVAIFMMSAYGEEYPEEAWEFYQAAGASSDWVTREFTAAGLHKLIAAHRERILPWLQEGARDPDPNLRRMVSEALRPVTNLRWIQEQPQFSLSVLRLMFAEAQRYPRTSVGNNLSDLSRRNPELIYDIVEELVESGDPNSYWIAERACRNLVKDDPTRVMGLLRVDEYHYKDRHFKRK